jgi:deazaflavin-dependent oxidoreductase (nitroreductase family)
MVEHTGRVSGLRRRVVLEVIARTEDALMVPSAWPNSDWYRNLRVEPLARISSGRLRSVPATARVLEQAEAESVFDRYAANHLRAAKALSSTLGLPLLDRTAMARSVPVVELSYRSEESERP